jgi:hypothetical protein
MGAVVTLFLIVLDSWSEAEQTIEFSISVLALKRPTVVQAEGLLTEPVLKQGRVVSNLRP